MMNKTLYVVMASANKGQDYVPCIKRGYGGCVIAYETMREAKDEKEKCYLQMREECHRLGVAHIARKYFKIIKFTQARKYDNN